MRPRTNQEWLRALKAESLEQEEALKDLRERILRSILAYLSHQASRALRRGEAQQLAQDCTQEALLTILDKLETFRGESQFTTWAYQIAVRLVLQEFRRRRWRDIPLEQWRISGELPAWPLDEAKSSDPERAAQQEEVWGTLKGIIEKELTERQRSVVVALAFQGMPLDLVADGLGTNRDNVYKILHDARKKLKSCLIEKGLTQEDILSVF